MLVVGIPAHNSQIGASFVSHRQIMADIKPISSQIRIALLALGVVALVMAPLSSVNPVVNAGKQYAVEITASAVALYASLRLINSVLSTAMETEVSGGAVLVSGTVQPLKVLEPVDDTVERVASVVFALALIAGVVTLALAPVTMLGLVLLGVGLIGLAWRPAALPAVLAGMLNNARGLGLAFGVVLPVGLLLAFAGGTVFTDRAVERANAVINSMTQTLEAEALVLPGEEAAQDSEPVQSGMAGAIESLQSRFFDGAATISGSATDIATSTGRYLELAGTVMARADELFQSFAELLVAYLFHLIVFPVLVVFVLLKLITPRGLRT